MSASAAASTNVGVARLQEAMATTRFVAYTPRSLTITAAGVTPVAPAQLRRDLAILRRDFDGLITYSSANGLEAIAGIARKLGFRAMIVGVWDPTAAQEVAAAVALARDHPELVMAVALGNEGLFSRRYSWATLRAALGELRAALPGVPLTTSEPFAYYLDAPPQGFLAAQDFLLPNVHAIYEPWFREAPSRAWVDFVGNVMDALGAAGKPVLVKETGVPSAPASAGFTPDAQARFWADLTRRLPASRTRAVAFFEAFDAPWKPAAVAAEFGRSQPEEAHWGLYTAEGQAKPVMAVLRRVWQTHAP